MVVYVAKIGDSCIFCEQEWTNFLGPPSLNRFKKRDKTIYSVVKFPPLRRGFWIKAENFSSGILKEWMTLKGKSLQNFLKNSGHIFWTDRCRCNCGI